MKLLLPLFALTLASASAQTQVNQLGVLTLSLPKVIGRNVVTIPFQAPRPGMFDVSVQIGQIYVGSDPYPVTFSINGVRANGTPAPRSQGFFPIGRGLVNANDSNVLRLIGPAANDVVGITLSPAPEGGRIVQQQNKPITLNAQDSTVWGTQLRFNRAPKMLSLTNWENLQDFATWDFEVKTPGNYTVTINQGCGRGQGGSKAAVSSGGASLPFTVEDTGGFQNWESLEVGKLSFSTPGLHRVEVRALSKEDDEVMNVQKIVLELAKPEEDE